jgi:hypothetical protein
MKQRWLQPMEILLSSSPILLDQSAVASFSQRNYCFSELEKLINAFLFGSAVAYRLLHLQPHIVLSVKMIHTSAEVDISDRYPAQSIGSPGADDVFRPRQAKLVLLLIDTDQTRYSRFV